MTIYNKKFFLILMSLFPISIIIGSSISLTNTLLIVLIYLITFFDEKHYKFIFKNNTIKILLIIYLCLIANSFFSLNFEIGLNRNIGFIRLIFLFISINYFFYSLPNNFRIFKVWTIILLIFVADVYFERLSGTNIFGWGAAEIDGIMQPNGLRVVSFFKDEPVAGAYLYSFIFLISGCLITFLKKNYNNNFLFLIIVLVLFFSILITGERSNTLKAIFSLILFISIIDIIKPEKKLLIFIIVIGSLILIVSNSTYFKNRYITQFYYYIVDKDSKNIKSSYYYQLYRSGYNVFKNAPLTGVGNKNYRIETCKSNLEKVKKLNYLCSTHPHQIYFEFLSEHGLIGTIILIFLFLYLIFKNIKIILRSQNYIQIGSFVYLLSVFLPLLPSGAFFSDFNITFFFINLSILYAINKDTNIFFVEKKNKNSNF